MHHSLGNGEFGYIFHSYLLFDCFNAVSRMYQRMIKHITVADTVLEDVDSAASEIDRVLESESPSHQIEISRTDTLYSNAISLPPSVS